MAIAVRNEGSKVNSNINVTPMVDVMLVLLIIFMVITPMLQNKVARSTWPRWITPSPMPDADKEDAIVVAVTRDGGVFLGQDKVATERAWREGPRQTGRHAGQDDLCSRRCACAVPGG